MYECVFVCGSAHGSNLFGNPFGILIVFARQFRPIQSWSSAMNEGTS